MPTPLCVGQNKTSNHPTCVANYKTPNSTCDAACAYAADKRVASTFSCPGGAKGVKCIQAGLMTGSGATGMEVFGDVCECAWVPVSYACCVASVPFGGRCLFSVVCSLLSPSTRLHCLQGATNQGCTRAATAPEAAATPWSSLAGAPTRTAPTTGP